MTTRMRGLANGTAVFIIALGIALGIATGMPDTAEAKKKRVVDPVPAGCVWGNLKYSNGGRHTYVDLFGWTVEMECRNGSWVQVGSREPKKAA
jgi:hypothetical protein